MKSKLGKLNWKDVAKGAIRAAIITFLTGVVQIFQAGPIEWTFAFWQPTIYAAILSFAGSLLKSLLTNSDDQFVIKEQI